MKYTKSVCEVYHELTRTLKYQKLPIYGMASLDRTRKHKTTTIFKKSISWKAENGLFLLFLINESKMTKTSAV